MELQNLQQLLVNELKDLYNAENQILKALPKVIKNVDNEELKEALENHYEETEGHVERLEKVLGNLGESPKGKKCKAMQGLIEESGEMLNEDAEPAVMDAGLIVGLQKVEHYEISGYGSCIAFAKMLGDRETADILAKTLKEEEAADEKLTQIAESVVNVKANK
ncbi:MAG TPA: ferritin-like domain-containing protein [Tepidisphaeraceae bacterium]|jgi:ferritin-like metal-binding protein YciE